MAAEWHHKVADCGPAVGGFGSVIDRLPKCIMPRWSFCLQRGLCFALKREDMIWSGTIREN